MADVIDVLNNLTREELPRVYEESLPDLVPILQFVKTSDRGVARGDNRSIGRGWEVKHTFNTGVAGLMQYGNPQGPDVLNSGQVPLLDFVNGPTSFPDANEAPHTGSLLRSLVLHMTLGNFGVPTEWMSMELLEANQIEQIGRDIKAVADNLALQEGVSLFGHSASDGTYDVNVMGAVSSFAESGTSNTVVITLDTAYGTIHSFRVGQVVDIVADSGGSIQTGTATDGTDRRNYDGSGYYIHCLVTDVDYIGETITIKGINSNSGAVAAFTDGGGWGSQAIAAADWIVLRNCSTVTTASRPVISWGFNSWIKNSGTIMGGATSAEALDLDVYSQFKSVVDAVSGPLTDIVLNTKFGKFSRAYPDVRLDTIVTTPGVTLKYVEQPFTNGIGSMQYDRQGKGIMVRGGWQIEDMSANGMSMKWVIAPLCLQGNLMGLKMGNGNIKRFVPPSLTRGDARFSSAVQFLGQVYNNGSIFMPGYNSSGNPVMMSQCPFWLYSLIAPTDTRSLKLTSLTEATF